VLGQNPGVLRHAVSAEFARGNSCGESRRLSIFDRAFLLYVSAY
jgi:hypothetical protein